MTIHPHPARERRRTLLYFVLSCFCFPASGQAAATRVAPFLPQYVLSFLVRKWSSNPTTILVDTQVHFCHRQSSPLLPSTKKERNEPQAFLARASLLLHLVLVDLASCFLRQEPVRQQRIAPQSRDIGTDNSVYLPARRCAQGMHDVG